MGFAQVILLGICHLVSLWFAVKRKVVLWDTSVGNRLVREKDLPRKWVAFGLGLLTSFFILMSAASQIVLSQVSSEPSAEFEEVQRKIERVFTPEEE